MGDLIELLERDGAERTPEQKEALYMHEQLIMHRQMVEVGLASMCRDLKEIRDKKLYVQLGYDEFGAYTEAEHGIKQRQAYKYIQVYEKLGLEILHSSAKIGVTKLLEIAALDRDEREELMAAHTVDELADMSTEEVKRLTEQVKKLQEQISFLESEKESTVPTEVVQQPFEEIQADIREEVEIELQAKFDEERTRLEQRIASLEIAAARSVSEDELKKYRENAMQEAKAVAAEETKKLKSELRAATEAKKQETAKIDKILEEKKKAEERANKAEEQAKRAAELEAKIAAAEAEKAAVEKQIKLSANPALARFKFLFEAWQNAANALIEQFGKLDDDTQRKMVHAMKAVVEGMGL